ncbi:MAG: hypothetical protein LBC53_08175 [Spirochaetaceae bacterium]|jgi:hypothetical protein|nr:hypothetical protein [Spirochaetaceae bacterium]
MGDFIKKWMNVWISAPFSLLSSSMILILASSRMAYALTCVLALLWTFTFTRGLCYALSKITPRFGADLIVVIISAFAANLFYTLWFIINPVLACECRLLIMFSAPVFCLGGFIKEKENREISSLFTEVLRAALSIGILTVAAALIREPLGYGTLSLPYEKNGEIIELFNADAWETHLPHIVSSASGGLLILGYAFSLLRIIKRRLDNPNKNKQKGIK